MKKMGIASLVLAIFFSTFIGFKQLNANEFVNEKELDKVSLQSTQTLATTDPDAFTFLPAANMITGYDVSKGGTDVVIPSEINGVKVTTIGNNAFDKKGITSVVLPEGITKIGRSAFANSSSGGTQNSLQGLVLPESLITIDQSAFYNCTGVGDLIIPDNVITVGHSAFAGAEVTSLTLGSSVKTIDPNAFKNNKISGKVTIPESVTTIGASAFEANLTLSEINIPSQVTSIANNAFKMCNLKNVVIPATVTQIGSSAFASNNNLESVQFSEGLLTIGDSAFAGCRIKSLSIPDSVTTLGMGAFSNNVVLSEIHLGTNITNIPETCFFSNALTSFEIPETVQSIGANAFNANQMLEIDLPDTVTTLDASAFGLQRVNVTITKMLPKNIGGINYSWYCDLNRLANVYTNKMINPDASWGVFDAATNTVTTTQTGRGNIILKYNYKLKNNTIESDTAFRVFLDLSGAQEFEVYFKDADGTLLETQYVPFAQPAKEPTVRPNPPVGKKFLKWDKSFTSVLDVLEVNAVYETEKMNVTFTEVDDSIIHGTDTVDYGELISKPADDPQKKGYTFGGWFTDKACTLPWDFSNDRIASDVNLYAKWTINNYTITYNNLQGSATSNPTTYTVETEAITLTAPTSRDHYTFDGWYDGSGNKISEITKGSTGNVVLVARWKTVGYAITYLDTKGATNPNPVTIDIENEFVLQDLEDVAGYTFAGWVDERGTTVTKINKGTTVPITLRAKWNLIDYTITYHMPSGITTTLPTTYTIESSPITLGAVDAIVGYTFANWKNDKGAVMTVIPTGTYGDLDLYAQYNANQYEVTLVDGIKDETITVTYNSIFGNLPIPQKDHYIFMGWFTQENGQGDLIEANSKVTNAHDFKLYAYWQKVFFEDSHGNIKFQDGQDENYV